VQCDATSGRWSNKVLAKQLLGRGAGDTLLFQASALAGGLWLVVAATSFTSPPPHHHSLPRIHLTTSPPSRHALTSPTTAMQNKHLTDKPKYLCYPITSSCDHAWPPVPGSGMTS
jgi:hypothetical protein